MPRKDPHTGCIVATLPDIIAADAKRKGRTYEEEEADFWAHMEQMRAEDKRNTDARLRKDALSILAKAVLEYNKDNPDYLPGPIPVSLVKILHVNSDSSCRRSSEELEAECIATDGCLYRYKFGTFQEAGTFINPPDYDEYLSWVHVPISEQVRTRLAPLGYILLGLLFVPYAIAYSAVYLYRSLKGWLWGMTA